MAARQIVDRKLYICDTWDTLCDYGEHEYDSRVYLSRGDAQKRAERLTYDDGYVEHFARVVELKACWEGL